MLSLLQWHSLETKRKWNEQVKWLNRGTTNFKDPNSKLLWREGKISIILESLDGNFRGEESVAFQPKERKNFCEKQNNTTFNTLRSFRQLRGGIGNELQKLISKRRREELEKNSKTKHLLN